MPWAPNYISRWHQGVEHCIFWGSGELKKESKKITKTTNSYIKKFIKLKRISLPIGFFSNSYKFANKIFLLHIVLSCGWNYCYFILLVNSLCRWNIKHLMKLANSSKRVENLNVQPWLHTWDLHRLTNWI